MAKKSIIFVNISFQICPNNIYSNSIQNHKDITALSKYSLETGQKLDFTNAQKLIDENNFPKHQLLNV